MCSWITLGEVLTDSITLGVRFHSITLVVRFHVSLLCYRDLLNSDLRTHLFMCSWITLGEVSITEKLDMKTHVIYEHISSCVRGSLLERSL